MRKDEQGYFYFVDRIGDTFRWKGENVATSEVSEAICAFPGVKHANVYGVAIPATEGRAGMATLVTEDELDLAGFRQHLMSRLPPYARPLFLRIRKNMDLTGTFKYSKTDLVRQGFDPAASNDASISTTWNRAHSLRSTRNCMTAFKWAAFASRQLRCWGKVHMFIDEIRSDFTQLQVRYCGRPHPAHGDGGRDPNLSCVSLRLQSDAAARGSDRRCRKDAAYLGIPRSCG